MGTGCSSVTSLLASNQAVTIRSSPGIEQYQNGVQHSNPANYQTSKFVDGMVSSTTEIEIPNTTFWNFVKLTVRNVVQARGVHFDWLLDLGPPRTHLKYSEINSRTKRLASGLHRLGLRSQAVVIFYTNNVSLVHLLYFAVWRLNARVWICHSSTISSDLIENIASSKAGFLVCDRSTEGPSLLAMKKKQLILLSIGKLRQSTSIDLIDILEDDGTECSEEEDHGGTSDDVILITNNGSRHSHKSLIAVCLQGSFLRYSHTTPKYYFFPVSPDPSSQITTILWPLSALITGKTMIVVDRPTTHVATLAIKEFSIAAICGCPESLKNVSKHIAEQGGSMTSVTTIILHTTSITSVCEKLLRRGFPSLKTIDVVYGFEETLFVTATMSSGSTIKDVITVVGGPLVHPHAVGTLRAGIRGKVIDLDTGVRLGPGEPGQLCFKTQAGMAGYLDRPGRETKRALIDGWFHTGDFGYYDSSGTFYVTGPVAEVFKYYADYISPRELEEVLQSHPEVGACMVVGVPDGIAGHLACGVIVKRIGSNVSAKEIRTYFNSRVSNSKQLRGGIIFIDNLPQGKDTSLIRQQLLVHIRKNSI